MATSHHRFPQSRPEKDEEEGGVGQGRGKKQPTERKKRAQRESSFFGELFTGRRGAGGLALTTYDATAHTCHHGPPPLLPL